MRDAVLSIASAAQGHLEEARALKDKVPVEARGTLLPSLACHAYLRALESANFDPFAPELMQRGQREALWHVLQVKWHLLNKSF